MQGKPIKVILITIIVIIIAIIGIGVLYIETDMFKSKELLFKKYISQNIDDIVDIIDFSAETDFVQYLKENDYTENMEGTLSYLEEENDETEEYQIKGEGIINNSQNQSYRKIDINYQDEEIMSIEGLSQEEMYGIRLSSLVKQFVSVQNTNLSYLISSLGYESQYFSDNFTEIDISSLMVFTDEEVESLKDTYINLMIANIDSKSYKSKRNVMITLCNGESPNTTQYSITITQNELDNICRRILTQAIEDQIILQKIDQIDSKLQEAGITLSNENTLKEQYKSKLQEMLDSIEYTGEDLREVVFNVYKFKGKTIRTEIKTETEQHIIDLDSSDGKTVTFKTIKLVDSQTSTVEYSFTKNNNSQEKQRAFSYSDSQREIEVKYSMIEEQENKKNLSYEINYTDTEIEEIKLSTNKEITIGESQEIPVELEEGNNIILNQYDGEQISSILENLKQRAISSLTKSNQKINTKLLNKLLITIEEKEKQRKEQEQNDLDLEIEKFNNQFNLYEGENLEAEHVQKLIKVIGKNMQSYKIISGNEIEILIEEDVQNEEAAENIASLITDEYTYNVKIQYGEDEKIEVIYISVYIDDD